MFGVRRCLSSRSYRLSVGLDDTVRTPRTSFPMRANASQAEPLLQRHMCDALYRWQDKERASAPLWVLHDGPPYANGELHVGHALNKILKDIVNRYKLLKGYRVSYIPGWDCHGLPIELKALEFLVKKERRKMNELNGVEIRRVARKWAEDHISLQLKDFRRWGVLADWEGEQYYTTFSTQYESEQLKVFQSLFEKGMIFRALKPVYWSPSSKSALAESELEYVDNHQSLSVYVKYEFTEESILKLQQHFPSIPSVDSVVIWTTTPWTLPGSLAVAHSTDLTYSIVQFRNQVYLILNSQALSIFNGEVEELGKISGQTLSEMKLKMKHPFLDRIVPMIESEFVIEGSGSGFVHTAPAHGQEDFIVSQRNGIEILNAVNMDGTFNHLAGDRLSGKKILQDGQDEVIAMLEENGSLVKKDLYKHRYPYDWRTKKPIIQMATEQWFISLSGLKENALKSLENVEITPVTGRARLTSTVDSRSEWCISRQRHWGVPIPAFINPDSGELLMTSETIDHFCNLVEEHGTDCWWELPVEKLLPSKYSYENTGIRYEKTFDTLDVWFDSGTSWAGALKNKHVTVPVDLVVEGSDQHRGWFQSLLLTCNAVHGTAPYKRILSHGFVIDEKLQKMSKSLGNIVSPKDVVDGLKGKFEANGADVLRFWVASANSSAEVTIGPQVIARNALSVRKIRNTFRYLVGSLKDYDHWSTREKFLSSASDLKPLEKWIFASLAQYMDLVEECYDRFDFPRIAKATEYLVTNTLSQTYFEAIKASIYCDDPSLDQRSYMQMVLFESLRCLMLSMSPVLPHTTQAVYNHIESSEHKAALNGVRCLEGMMGDCFFTANWISKEYRELWKNEALLEDWKVILHLREKVHYILEAARVVDKFFLGNFSEVCILLQVPESFLKTRAGILLKELAKEDQLHSLLCSNSIELIVEGDPVDLEERYKDRLYIREFELDSPSNHGSIVMYLHHPEGQAKCNRCRRYRNEFKDQVHTPEGDRVVCMECLRVIEKLCNDWIQVE